MKRSLIPVAVLACLLAASAVSADDDPVKVDAKHYTVEFENDAVRVLRIQYGPGEKSVMHHHPASVAVYLTDVEVTMTYPDGKTEVLKGKAGGVQETPAGAHLPHNTGTKSMELILVELKGKGEGTK